MNSRNRMFSAEGLPPQGDAFRVVKRGNRMGEMLLRARLSRNLRACLCLAFLALFAAGSAQPVSAQAPTSVLGVECSRVGELGIDKMMNVRAHLILMGCGLEKPAQPAPSGLAAGPKKAQPAPTGPLGPPTNVNTITRTQILPQVTQSESMVWSSDGQTIVVNYNDHTTPPPTNYSGVSVSTDGGASFTQLVPPPFATGHGTNFGDPIVVFNAALGKWFAGDLANGCGGGGIGLWTSLDGITWSTGACAHLGNNDDRESMCSAALPGRQTSENKHAGLKPGATTHGRQHVILNRPFGTFSASW